MSDKRPCVRCARGIDAWAKICPFCNWDQSAAPPAQEPPKPISVTEYRPPEEFDLKKKAAMAGAGVVVLVLAFLVGMVINSDDTPKVAPKTVEEQLAEDQVQAKRAKIKRADTPLVPVDGPAGIEQPITSAPAAPQPGGTANDFARSDATAVSATEYAELAKRAQAEKKRMAATVDPRSLTGPAYTPPPRPAQQQMPPSMASSSGPSLPANNVPVQRTNAIRTRPVPQHQPLPHIASSGTARLSLVIGPDGRVRSIDIEKPLARNTAQLVSAVQSWRFKPATVNGEPVAAPYSVEITFKQ